jgi:N6-L-threonylcarbamoyladenine synthase
MNNSKVLAFETSCDDTSVALVNGQGVVLAMSSAHQDLAHAPFGGVVPEIASRNHTLTILPLIDQVLEKAQSSWDQVTGLAVTNRPGLVGSLLVGLTTVKTLAQVRALPWVAINHLEGHLLAPFLRDHSYAPSFSWDQEYVALAVSGGHTSLYHCQGFGKYQILGQTVDDAAGEAYDKFAKMLGLGFPGGALVDQSAQTGDATRYDFPRGMIHEDHLNMSFSGLKASSQRLISSLDPALLNSEKPNLCASFQAAVVETLMKKLSLAQKRTACRNVVVTGGVSANRELRTQAEKWASQKKLNLAIPPIRYCTDNAAMIGLAGMIRLSNGQTSDLGTGPSPSSWSGDFLNL